MNSDEDIDAAARAWFVRLGDEAARESDWLSFLAWIEADEAHRLAYDRIERMWVELDEPVKLSAANDERPSLPRRRRAVWMYPAFAAAATLVLAIGVGVSLMGEGVEVYRTDDRPRVVRLDDGSEVVLNRHSQMEVRMRRASREVILADGEAAFDVAHDASRPFAVMADGRDIRVLGTAFNVLSHEDRFSVSVARGVVSVTPKGEVSVRLGAGRKIEQVGRTRPVLSAVNPEQTSAWRDGVLIYRDADLDQIAEDLSRYLDRSVRASPSSRDVRYTGVLQLGDETTMLKQLEDLLPVRATHDGGSVVLTGRAD